MSRLDTIAWVRWPVMLPVTPIPPAERQPPVPWRIIWATIFSVVSVVAAIYALLALHKIITWLLIAGFFAIILGPPVDFLQHRLHFRRSLAALVVFLLGVILSAAMLYSFIRPIVDQANE